MLGILMLFVNLPNMVSIVTNIPSCVVFLSLIVLIEVTWVTAYKGSYENSRVYITIAVYLWNIFMLLWFGFTIKLLFFTGKDEVEKDFTCLKGQCVPSCYLINYRREKSDSKFKSSDYDNSCIDNNTLSNKSTPTSEQKHGTINASVRSSVDAIYDGTLYVDKTTMNYVDDKYDVNADVDIIPDSLRVKNVRPNTSLGEKSITFSNVSDAIKSSVKMIEKELMYVDKTTSDYIDEADTNDATSKSLRNDKYPQATDVFTVVKVVDELNNGDNLTEIHSVVQDYGENDTNDSSKDKIIFSKFRVKRLTIMNDSSYDDEIKDYADFSSSLKKYIDVKVNGNRWDVIVVPLVFLFLFNFARNTLHSYLFELKELQKLENEQVVTSYHSHESE